jgi:hypothetical protein
VCRTRAPSTRASSPRRSGDAQAQEEARDEGAEAEAEAQDDAAAAAPDEVGAVPEAMRRRLFWKLLALELAALVVEELERRVG